jgi:hypothetical protein
LRPCYVSGTISGTGLIAVNKPSWRWYSGVAQTMKKQTDYLKIRLRYVPLKKKTAIR